MEDKIFVKITNKDIYTELQKQGTKIDKISKKVGLAFWISSTALTLAVISITAVITACKF